MGNRFFDALQYSPLTCFFGLINGLESVFQGIAYVAIKLRLENTAVVIVGANLAIHKPKVKPVALMAARDYSKFLFPVRIHLF